MFAFNWDLFKVILCEVVSYANTFVIFQTKMCRQVLFYRLYTFALDLDSTGVKSSDNSLSGWILLEIQTKNHENCGLYIYLFWLDMLHISQHSNIWK